MYPEYVSDYTVLLCYENYNIRNPQYCFFSFPGTREVLYAWGKRNSYDVLRWWWWWEGGRGGRGGVDGRVGWRGEGSGEEMGRKTEERASETDY